MDGRMDGWMTDGEIYVSMDRYMDGWARGWKAVCMYEWMMAGIMEGWMGMEWVDKGKNWKRMRQLIHLCGRRF